MSLFYVECCAPSQLDVDQLRGVDLAQFGVTCRVVLIVESEFVAMRKKAMADDLIQVDLRGTSQNIKQALAPIHGVDFGCRCSVTALPSGSVSLTVFVPSGQISALQRGGAPLGVMVGVGRNASADSRASQARVARALPAGVSRLRGRGTQPQGTPAPETISAYLDTELIDSQFQALAKSSPTLCSAVPLPHKSVEGRTINAYRLGLSGSPKSSGVLFTACAHAREWGGAEICLGLATDLIDAYESKTGLTYGKVNYTAAQVALLITTVDLFLLPCINPDGRIYSMTPGPDGDPMWRRNRNNPPVDLNRNYDFLWDFRTAFDPHVADGSYSAEQVPPACDNPNDPRFQDLYHGSSPASEPECKNVVWILDQFPQIGSFVDIHSYTGDFLYSWGDAPDQNTDPQMNFHNSAFNGKRGVSDSSVYGEYITPSDRFIAQAMSTNFVSVVADVRGSRYQSRQDFLLSVGQASGSLTYPTSGAVDDYAFSRSYGGGKTKVHGFTLEFGLEANFHPDWPEMGSIIEEIDAGLVSFCLNPPDPCAYLEAQAEDLENQLQVLIDAFNDHEIPEPRTTKNIAGVQAEIQKLRAQTTAALRAAQNCRRGARTTISGTPSEDLPTTAVKAEEPA